MDKTVGENAGEHMLFITRASSRSIRYLSKLNNPWKVNQQLYWGGIVELGNRFKMVLILHDENKTIILFVFPCNTHVSVFQCENFRNYLWLSGGSVETETLSWWKFFKRRKTMILKINENTNHRVKNEYLNPRSKNGYPNHRAKNENPNHQAKNERIPSQQSSNF